jgi:hypothetical protein
MSQVAWKQGNRVNSQLLMVENQIANLTPDLSFGHNLCFRYPNGRYEPILDIYASISFQWYEKNFEARSFDPCNCILKIQESFWDSNTQHGNSLVSVRVCALTLFTLLGACEVTPGSPFLARNLVSPLLWSWAHYHTIYLIVKLIRINLMFIRLKDCSISIGPFINTSSTVSWISNILATH